MKTFEEVTAVVMALEATGLDNTTWWYPCRRTGEIKAAIECHDLFEPNTPDAETIDVTDIPTLIAAHAEVNSIDITEAEYVIGNKARGRAYYTAILYCCAKRRRKLSLDLAPDFPPAFLGLCEAMALTITEPFIAEGATS